ATALPGLAAPSGWNPSATPPGGGHPARDSCDRPALCHAHPDAAARTGAPNPRSGPLVAGTAPLGPRISLIGSVSWIGG
ncbi:hypothetical protein, partial [Actinokineospora pegani]|uniref:hypothetical protein n=1 Tax=Actinokineospora pegani TaxID=2654637 RepID=UPI0038B3935C